MQPRDVQRRPGNRATAGNGEVWNLVLPPAARILCHADVPPEVVVEAARRGSAVDVVTRCDLETWKRAVRGGVRMRCLWEPDCDVEYDLALLWDPGSDAAVRAWLADLHRLRLPPREIAVRTREPWKHAGPPWPLVDHRLRRAGWELGAADLALPEADRVRQLVEWGAYGRTPLYRHRRERRTWKSWITGHGVYRWFLPARLRRAHLPGMQSAGTALDAVLASLEHELGDRPRVERLFVSPNGVAIASVRGHVPGNRQSAILKVPYALMAAGRVARNAEALEWLARRRRELGRWGDAVPRLLARGTAGAWSYTLEERVEGTEAQSWNEGDAEDAMRRLEEFLAVFAHLGRPGRPVEAATIEHTCNAPVRRVAALLDAMAAERLHDFGAVLARRLEGLVVPHVPRHGDFKLENVLGSPRVEESLRILDWELWSPDGLPLLDLWHLLMSNRARKAGCAIGTAIRRWLAAPAPSGTEQRVLEHAAAGLDPRFVALTPFLYWLERIGPPAARGHWPNPGWEQRNVLAVLEVAAPALARIERAAVEFGEVRA